jgi:hypothetical protein
MGFKGLCELSDVSCACPRKELVEKRWRTAWIGFHIDASQGRVVWNMIRGPLHGHGSCYKICEIEGRFWLKHGGGGCWIS